MLKLDFCQTLLVGVYFEIHWRARLDSFVGRIWPASHQLMTSSTKKLRGHWEKKYEKKKNTGVYIQSEQDI